jgi:ribosome recycling factor
MQLNEILDNAKDAMNKAVDYCKSQLGKVRTGRASASLLDGINADFYGSMTPMSQMATISVPDARSIVIQPFDRTTLGAIEKAIQTADLGFNPQNDGNIIRISVPPLTEERRKEYVKMTKKMAEEGKIAVRNVRREQMETIKKSEKSKDITEDDKKRGEDEVQKLTDKSIKQIDEFQAAKEKELMED